MTRDRYARQDDAIAEAMRQLDGKPGVVVVHEDTCRIVGGDENTCTCTPITLKVGASS